MVCHPHAIDHRSFCFSFVVEKYEVQPRDEVDPHHPFCFIDCRGYLEFDRNGEVHLATCSGNSSCRRFLKSHMLQNFSPIQIESFAPAAHDLSNRSAEPLCPYFGRCGGCSFQHLPYEQQLTLKQTYLEAMFREVPEWADLEIKPILPSPKIYGYRNVITLNVRQQSGIPYLGFIEKDGRTFFPIDHCPIANETLNAKLPSVLEKFITKVTEKKRYRTSQIGVRIGRQGELYTTIRDRPLDQTLSASVLGKTLKYPGHSFFQVNDSILDDFVTCAANLLGDPRECDLVDLYCGVGLFAVTLADRYKRVLGIEESEESIKFASENARLNQLTHVSFVASRTEKATDDLRRAAGEKLHVIVDPPRRGMHREAIGLLLQMPGIQKLVYVSCYPESLIRDLQALSLRFRPVSVQPCDMFPQTKHMETIVLLIPKD